ncbi:MAG: hypothetical protein ACRCZO_13090 [Cetobacterium sp.]|uniref:hypothetical protein n=1 Tax=unclassified Cetobacterium TaxID=2630983 RepID=UPI000647A4D9|nr:hypothetical protein [Cetobacterium sp. ZWU0022]
MRFLLKLKLWLSIVLSFLILIFFATQSGFIDQRNEIKIEKTTLTDEEFQAKKEFELKQAEEKNKKERYLLYLLYYGL